MKRILDNKLLLLAFVVSVITYLIFFGNVFKKSHYFWGSDAQIKHVPARVYLYNKITKDHIFPFWTERMFLGFPIYADMENAYLHPVNIVSIIIFGPQLSYKILHFLEYLLGSICLYLLLKRKGIGIFGFVVTNTIYYFSTYFIDHQIHFGIIMSLYLLPAVFLFADKFIEKRQLKYIVFCSLIFINSVLWGHIQSAIIMYIGLMIYMVVFSIRKLGLSLFLSFFILNTIFIIIATLPQVLPTYQLYKQSTRDSSLRFIQGSYTPNMITFIFVPYLFGEHDSFIGNDIKTKWYTYTETYIYMGISSVLIGIFGLLLLKKDRLVIFSFLLFWTFLIFGFLYYNNLIPDKTPIITMFRYWTRTAVLSLFGVALLAGVFVDKLDKISFRNLSLGLILTVMPFLYIYGLNKISDGNIYKRVSKIVNVQNIQNYEHFETIKAIFVVTMSLIIFSILLKLFIPKLIVFTKLLLIFIVFFDLFYFSSDVVNYRLKNISEYKIHEIPIELTRKRVVLKSMKIAGMESLYYDVWSPFGISQFEQSEYIDHFKKLGIGDPRDTFDKLPEEPYEDLKNSGITHILDKDGIKEIDDKKLDILKDRYDGEYIEKEEGRIKILVNNPEEDLIGTYIKYDENWRLKINGTKSPTIKVDLFLYFPLEQGEHTVELYYYPKEFYKGLIISIPSFLLIIGVYIFYNRKNHPLKNKRWFIF